jgi:hypothetical protein
MLQIFLSLGNLGVSFLMLGLLITERSRGPARRTLRFCRIHIVEQFHLRSPSYIKWDKSRQRIGDQKCF